MALDSWQRHQRVGLALTVAFGLAGTAVAYFASREGVPGAEPAAPALPSSASGGPVLAITLPHAEPALPAGPHREKFHVSCTVCHSTQLVLNQPPFPEKKWAETVHKMVEAYGAPIGPPEEAEIVEYLTAIRGQE